MKKLKFKYDGKTITFNENTHAALFRAFFDWWKEKDMEACLYGTFNSKLRIMNEEYFEGTVIKKKNLKVMDNVYIITHITPAAMDKGIWRFLEAVKAEIIEPKPKEKTKTTPTPKKSAPKVTEEDDNDDDSNDENDEPDENDEQDEDESEDEMKALIAAALAKGKGKATSAMLKKLTQKKMAERDEQIKANLAKGNRAQ